MLQLNHPHPLNDNVKLFKVPGQTSSDFIERNVFLHANALLAQICPRWFYFSGFTIGLKDHYFFTCFGAPSDRHNDWGKRSCFIDPFAGIIKHRFYTAIICAC